MVLENKVIWGSERIWDKTASRPRNKPFWQNKLHLPIIPQYFQVLTYILILLHIPQLCYYKTNYLVFRPSCLAIIVADLSGKVDISV